MVDIKVMSSTSYDNNSSKVTYNFVDSNAVNDNMNIVNVPLIRQPIDVSVEQIIDLI